MADEIDVGATIPANDAAQPETQAAETPQAPEVDIDRELDDIWDKAQAEPGEDETAPRARDEHGRFLKADGEPEETPDAAKDSEGQPQEQEAKPEDTPAIEPPSSWSKEVREHWNAIPRETQEYIAGRERDMHRAITQQGEQLRALEPYKQITDYFADDFRAANMQPEQGIAALLQVQRDLARDPYGTVRDIAQRYGVDLTAYANADENAGQSPELASLAAQLQAAHRQIETLNSRVSFREQQEQNAFIQTAEQELASFLTENAIDDQTADLMVDRVLFYRTQHPDWHIKQVLKQAHEDLTWTDPARRQAAIDRELQAKREAEAKAAKERAEKARKAGSVNVKSSPVNARGSVTLDDALEQAWAASRAS